MATHGAVSRSGNKLSSCVVDSVELVKGDEALDGILCEG